MRGTWDDFTDKFGFSDGDGLEERDFEARGRIVTYLNEQPWMKENLLRAIEFDRAGCHNSCIIAIVQLQAGDETLTNEDVEALWLKNERKDADDFFGVAPPEFSIEMLIQHAYDGDIANLSFN